MIYYWSHRQEWPSSLNKLYQIGQISKQGFHKNLTRRRYYAEEKANLIKIICEIRVDHPTMCCRSMYYKINPVSMGRDRFESLCRSYGFTVIPRSNKRRTTDSTGVVRFDNLLKDLKLTSIDQAWSSDITYFELEGMFYYITFIIDCYSRRILGSHVSSRLFTEQTTLPAIVQAIKTRDNGIPPGMIFHSDGGGQYYDKIFLALTRRYGIRNSMCEYAYENGIAERINGVIKNNYLIHWNIRTLGDLTKSVDRAVHLYNEDKPHVSLQRMTPVEFERKTLNLQTRKEGKQINTLNLESQVNTPIKRKKTTSKFVGQMISVQNKKVEI